MDKFYSAEDWSKFIKKKVDKWEELKEWLVEYKEEHTCRYLGDRKCSVRTL